MREFVASLFTIATLGTGYLAYNARQQPVAPLAQAAPTEQVYSSDFAGMILPHLQAVFSPLDPTQGRFADAQLTNLRQLFGGQIKNVGAKEAIQIVDGLFPVLSERESYRAKLNTGASDTSNEYFNAQTARNWLARANVLAPPFQTQYANLVALQEKSGQQFERVAIGFEPYFEGTTRIVAGRSALDQRSTRVSYVNGQAIYVEQYGYPANAAYPQQVVQPTIGFQPTFGTRRVEVTRFEEHRSPFDEHRAGYEEHRNGFEEHRNGFEEHRNGFETHRSAFDDHPTGLNEHRSTFEEHRANGQTSTAPVSGVHIQPVGSQPQSTHNQPPAAGVHPTTVVHPQTVVHPPVVQSTQSTRPAGSN